MGIFIYTSKAIDNDANLIEAQGKKMCYKEALIKTIPL